MTNIVFFFRCRKLLYFEWTSVKKEIGYPKFYETLFGSASYSKSKTQCLKFLEKSLIF